MQDTPTKAFKSPSPTPPSECIFIEGIGRGGRLWGGKLRTRRRYYYYYNVSGVMNDDGGSGDEGGGVGGREAWRERWWWWWRQWEGGRMRATCCIAEKRGRLGGKYKGFPPLLHKDNMIIRHTRTTILQTSSILLALLCRPERKQSHCKRKERKKCQLKDLGEHVFNGVLCFVPFFLFFSLQLRERKKW